MERAGDTWNQGISNHDIDLICTEYDIFIRKDKIVKVLFEPITSIVAKYKQGIWWEGRKTNFRKCQKLVRILRQCLVFLANTGYMQKTGNGWEKCTVIFFFITIAHNKFS